MSVFLDRYVTRENLARFSKWASAALFLFLAGFTVSKLLAGAALLTLEGYLLFTAAYFGRRRQFVMCLLFAALSVALPAGLIYLYLFGVQQGIVVVSTPIKG